MLTYNMTIPLSQDWITHMPDTHNGRVFCTPTHQPADVLLAEANCECGLNQRHRHCIGCGKLLAIGDWAAPGIEIKI